MPNEPSSSNDLHQLFTATNFPHPPPLFFFPCRHLNKQADFEIRDNQQLLVSLPNSLKAAGHQTKDLIASF